MGIFLVHGADFVGKRFVRLLDYRRREAERTVLTSANIFAVDLLFAILT